MQDNNPFKKIGICGGGKMGTSFFEYICQLDMHIVFYIRRIEKLEKVKKKYIRKLSRMKKLDKQDNVIFTTDIKELSDCDVVFEFINEDLACKQQIVKDIIDVKTNPSQIIATGSSSFVPSRILEDYNINNLVGVHFIYPVQFIETAEVVCGEKTDNDVINKILDFVVFIGKKPVRVDEEVGCITTKVLTNIHNDAFKISKQYNISPQKIDEIIEKENFTSPPFKLSDIVGLDIINNCIFGHYEGKKEFNDFYDLRVYLKELLEKGYLGKKSGKGFYDYENLEEASNTSNDILKETKDLIVDRIKLLYINSCFKLVDGGWSDCLELDRIFCELNQTEIGPAQIALNLGFSEIVQKLNQFYKEFGELFKPSKVLMYANENGLGGNDIDGAIRDFRMGTERLPWDN